MKNIIDKNTLNLLPGEIIRLYDALNSKRQMQLEDINTVKSAIYRPLGRVQDKNFKLPDIYEMAQTLKAHILESLSSHPEGLFDVFPRDLKYSENASKQKTMLVCALEIVTSLSSTGCLKTSSTERGNSGISSKNKTPLCASVISPGFGLEPPPMIPTDDAL